MSTEPSSGYERLETQLAWHNKKSTTNQRSYNVLKVLEILAAGGIPLVATHSATIAATLGVLVVLFEGIQHLFQFQQNWLLFRSTCEALTKEKYLFIAKADVYSETDPETAKKLLAQRVESLISTEHTKWVSATKAGQEREAANQPGV